MLCGSITVCVQIAVHHYGVVALHGQFISLLLLGLLRLFIEIYAYGAHDGCHHYGYQIGSHPALQTLFPTTLRFEVLFVVWLCLGHPTPFFLCLCALLCIFFFPLLLFLLLSSLLYLLFFLLCRPGTCLRLFFFFLCPGSLLMTVTHTTLVGRVATGTEAFVLEVHFAAALTFGHLAVYLHSATGTDGGFLTYLVSTFGTFYYCHCFLFSLLSSLMSEPQFSQTVLTHQPALVYIGVHAVYPALTGVLPHYVVALILQSRLALRILGYHQLVGIQLAQ